MRTRLLRRAPSIITVANQHVPISTVLRLLGIDAADEPGRSMKHRCPFGDLNHSDGGAEAALRVYPDSNHAYCFACQQHYTPVRLLAQARDIDWSSAAGQLLDHIGYQPLSVAEQWQALSTGEPPPDTALLADALKTFCLRRIPDWETRQYDSQEAAMLTQCLALLDRVRTAGQAQQWLATTKQVMEQQFLPAHSSTS